MGDDSHATQLHLGEFVLADGLTKDCAVLCVIESCFICSLHKANGTSGGLQATVLEASHLQVKTLAESVAATDEVCFRNPPVFDCDFVTVHTAVADGVDGTTLHLSAAFLREHETMCITNWLWHDEQRQTTVCL